MECGAFDGVYLANTLDLELDHSWTGLLIEANPSSYERLRGRNRKAWSSNVCLSLLPYPTKVCKFRHKHVKCILIFNGIMDVF